jgi:septum formation protein
MKQLILGSGSPRRKELLAEIVQDFDVIPSNFEEDMTLPLPPEDLALRLSEGKAQDVAKRYTNAIILAVDTFVIVDGELLGKPKDIEDAKKMLRKESGKKQQIISGLTVLDTTNGRKLQKVVVSEVVMRNLLVEEIAEYVTTHEVLDKSGSYAIQEIGDKFVEKIEGSFTNIMGLPIEEVKEMLKEFGIEAL